MSRSQDDPRRQVQVLPERIGNVRIVRPVLMLEILKGVMLMRLGCGLRLPRALSRRRPLLEFTEIQEGKLLALSI